MIRLLSVSFNIAANIAAWALTPETSQQTQEFLAQTGENFYISSMDTENYCPPCFLHRLPALARPLLRLAR